MAKKLGLADLGKLTEFATDRQREYIELLKRTRNNYQAAAEIAGVSRATIRKSMEFLRIEAARQGFSPEHDLTHPVAPGQKLRGASTLYGAEGEIKQQWIKTQEDVEQTKALLQAAADAMSENIRRERVVKAPKHDNADLLNLFTITDYHLGQRSWPEETGDDWDTDIAEDLLYRWFAQAIQTAPDAHTAVFGQIGDFIHYDGLEAVTPASGHVLDADTRYQKLVRVAIRSIRRITRELLRTHQHVHLVMCDANHDESGSAWLRELFCALYEDEPRVTVDRSPDTYYCYEWGRTVLFWHHGHRAKMEKLDTIFARKFREQYGRAKYCYGHCGHLHHLKALETNLMTVEQHRTLAAKDAYASSRGYLSDRSASVTTYHKEHGEVGRLVISPEMV